MVGDLPGVARVQQVGGGRGGWSGAVHVSVVRLLVLQDIIYQERGGDIFLVVGSDIRYVLETRIIASVVVKQSRANLRYSMLRHRGDGVDLAQT